MVRDVDGDTDSLSFQVVVDRPEESAGNLYWGLREFSRISIFA